MKTLKITKDTVLFKNVSLGINKKAFTEALAEVIGNTRKLKAEVDHDGECIEHLYLHYGAIEASIGANSSSLEAKLMASAPVFDGYEVSNEVGFGKVNKAKYVVALQLLVGAMQAANRMVKDADQIRTLLNNI